MFVRSFKKVWNRRSTIAVLLLCVFACVAFAGALSVFAADEETEEAVNSVKNAATSPTLQKKPTTSPANPVGTYPLPPVGPTRIGSDRQGFGETEDKSQKNVRPKLEGDVMYYHDVYGAPPKATAKPVELTRETVEGEIGDFDQRTVEIITDGHRYRVPRAVFGKRADIRPGVRARFQASEAELKSYEINR